MEELRKCPFCGASAFEYRNKMQGLKAMMYAVVQCSNCGAKIEVHGQISEMIKTEEMAIKAWNRRCCE